MKFVRKTFGVRGLLCGVAIAAVGLLIASRVYESLHPDENELTPTAFVAALANGDLERANSALVDGKFVINSGRLEFHYHGSNSAEGAVDWGPATQRFDELKRAEIGFDLGSFAILDPNRKWVTIDPDTGVGEEIVSSPVYNVWFRVLNPGGYFYLDPSHSEYFTAKSSASVSDPTDGRERVDRSE